jgi:hypothetical protein
MTIRAGRKDFVDYIGIGVLTRIVDRDLVDEVLAETGKREKRQRLLPARVVVYFVMAMCLFFDDAYEEVIRKLVNGLAFLRSWSGDWQVPTTSAISQARMALGPEVLKRLFERTAGPVASHGTPGAWYQGWRVAAVDGVLIDVPDTPENRKEFGGPSNHLRAGAFPQIRLVGLNECGTHAPIAARFGGFNVSERKLAWDLLPEMCSDMLVLFDRGFYSYEYYAAVTGARAQAVFRLPKSVILPVLERLPDNSYLSELVPAQAKADIKKGKRVNPAPGTVIAVRVIEYQITNRNSKEETIRLVTSILDHELAPAVELARLYHERWEYELGLRELKTYMVADKEQLRSRKPELVEQETWALLLTHYAIRVLTTEAADDLDHNDHIDGLDPDRLSFTRSLRVVRRQVTNQAAFSPSTPQPRPPRYP